MGEWKEKKNRAPDLKYLERESLKKGDSDTGTAADVELVMKKYDRESNTRVWQGKPASIIRWLSVLFSVYSIYVTLFSTALPEIRLSMFLGMILILGYLHYPIQKGDGRINHMPWYDWVLMAVGAVPFFYFAANAHAIIKLATRVTKNPVMVLMAILAVLSLMELCRRCVGIPILCVVGALLVYTFATVRFGKVIYDLFYTTSGVMNTPINVCAKYIVVFIIFGAFLERTGISNFFIDLANCLCGSSAGIDIRQDYDFSLSSWYLQEQIETGETVEIRFYLDREGDYEKAEYEIGYIQMEGKGEVTDSEGVRLVNREVRPLAEVPELDRKNPVRQVFTLFYRSTSARRSELKFFVRDNFGQERELTVTFDTANDTAGE